jgi:hypothetical protein
MTNKYLAFVFVYFLFYIYSNGQQYTINDKTKYYVKDIENFNNYSSNSWELLEDKQLKIIAKALNINTDEAKKIITSTRYYNHPKNKKNTDVAYIMYKVCELNGYTNGGFKYTRLDDVLCLMYVPNDLNKHLPADKLAENGKGFFQVTRKESISTTPLSSDYYKPMVSLKDENYSFGFRFGAKDTDSLVVQKIIKSSPAEKAGLKVDDIIVEYNGQNVKNKSIIDASKIFKESGFTNNTFKILRNNTMQSITMDKVNAKTLEFVCVSTNCDNGNCVIENINGYTIKGNFKDGNIMGNALFTAEDGFVFYEGPVKKLSSDFNNYNFVKHGFGKETHRNGNSFEGNYVNGQKDGNGVIIYANGTQKKGIWKDDKYYDDISIGFANERFRAPFERIYLHHPTKDFKSKMVDVSDEEKKKTMSRYNLSEADIDKLFALCDMKYKPTHLNTPAKIKSIIEQYQKEKPYEAYFVAPFYGTDGETYYIIYLPTAYNTWLPEAIKFDEIVDGLYFCVPASEVYFIDYFAFESALAMKKGAEEDKLREKEQADLAAKHYEWAAKNKFIGVVMIQYENEMVENMYDRYKYNVITIFAPLSQTVEESDYQTLLTKYKNFYKASGYKYVAINFEEGLDEVQATEKANKLTQTHRFSVNTNFSYTIPEYKITSSFTSDKSLKELDEEIKQNQEEINKLSKEMLEEKTQEKIEMRSKIFQEIITTNAKTISEPTKVQIIDILSTDKYYNENKKFIGKTGTIQGSIVESTDGTFHGTIQFEGEKYSTLFYKVKIEIINE